jgi:hypothetical protein
MGERFGARSAVFAIYFAFTACAPAVASLPHATAQEQHQTAERGPARTAPSRESSVPSAPDSTQSRVVAPNAPSVAQEHIILAASQTWPEHLPGSDAVLAAAPALCRNVNPSPTRCTLRGDPVQALADALTMPALSDGDVWALRRQLQLGRAAPSWQRNPKDVAKRQQASLQRDQRLAGLQPCAAFAAGFIQQLRADLFAQCSHTIARVNSPATAALPNDAQAVLRALDFASRLLRFTVELARPGKAITKERVASYAERELLPWVTTRADWLHEQNAAVDAFTAGSYAHAIALWAHAEAWAALIHILPVLALRAEPSALQDYELRHAMGARVEALVAAPLERGAPRFALALNAIGASGSTQPRHAERWLLAALNAVRTGRKAPSSALLRLIVPRLDLPPTPNPRQRLWELLPAHYASGLVTDVDVSDRASLASLTTQGFAPALRQRLIDTAHAASSAAHARSKVSAERSWALAQLHLRLGVLSHERVQFQWAQQHVQALNAVPHHFSDANDGGRRADVDLLSALVDTLVQAPADASEWPPAVAFDTHRLDAFSEASSTPHTQRWIAKANSIELRVAAPLPHAEYIAALSPLSDIARELKGTVHACVVNENLDERKDTWGMDTGTCPERCPALGWQHQRLVERPIQPVCE